MRDLENKVCELIENLDKDGNAVYQLNAGCYKCCDYYATTTQERKFNVYVLTCNYCGTYRLLYRYEILNAIKEVLQGVKFALEKKRVFDKRNGNLCHNLNH